MYPNRDRKGACAKNPQTKMWSSRNQLLILLETWVITYNWQLRVYPVPNVAFSAFILMNLKRQVEWNPETPRAIPVC